MQRLPYVYVVATSFSGTTLLSLLLDGHPRLVSIGELDNDIPNALRAEGSSAYLCSCGQPIRACPFFLAIQEQLAADGVELDLHDFRTRLGTGLEPTLRRLLFGAGTEGRLVRARDALLGRLPPVRRHIDGLMARNHAIARAACAASGKEVFVDTSKGVARVPHLQRDPELELKVIHIVRDARAFIRSGAKHGDLAPDRLARVWTRTHTAALRLEGRLGPERYLRFRWEDFCAEPAATLERICAFIGVEPADLVGEVNARPHHVIGNRMRLQPVRPIRSDESWRETLGAEQLSACERFAGELNRRLAAA